MNSQICNINGKNKLHINKSAPRIPSLILDIRMRKGRENILFSSMIDFENVNTYRKVKQILHFTELCHVLTFCHIAESLCPPSVSGQFTFQEVSMLFLKGSIFSHQPQCHNWVENNILLCHLIDIQSIFKCMQLL